eukprot:12934106-Prorocentrum_lima.AAC.1
MPCLAWTRGQRTGILGRLPGNDASSVEAATLGAVVVRLSVATRSALAHLQERGQGNTAQPGPPVEGEGAD